LRKKCQLTPGNTIQPTIQPLVPSSSIQIKVGSTSMWWGGGEGGIATLLKNNVKLQLNTVSVSKCCNDKSSYISLPTTECIYVLINPNPS
jgi:hypothetical protein